MVGARKHKKRPKRRHCDVSWAIGILFFQTFFCLTNKSLRYLLLMVATIGWQGATKRQDNRYKMNKQGNMRE